MDLEKYIGMAKTAKEFAEDKDMIVRFGNVAKAHINGLSDMILRLCVEVKTSQNKIGNLEDTMSLIRTHSKDEWVIKKINEVLEWHQANNVNKQGLKA